MKFLLFAVLLLCSCALISSRNANKDEIDIVVLLKERLSLPKTESNKELLEKLGLSQKSTWEKTKEFLGKSEEQYIVENLKQRMGLPLDDKSNIILKDELLGLPSFQIPHRTWLQRLADIFGLGRKTMKERLYDALGGAAALEMLRRSTSDIGGRKVEDTIHGLKEKAYEKIGENVAGTVKEKGHNYKETLTCNTKECGKVVEKEPSHGMLWGMLSTVSNFVFGNQTKTKQDKCSGDYYSAKECAKEKAKETLESAKDTVVCTAEMAKDKLCDIRDAAMEKGAEALHTAQAATHRVEDLYESAKEKVEEVVDRSKQTAKEKLGDVKERAKDTYEDIKERTKETYEGAKEKLSDAKEKAKDTYEGVKEKTQDVYEGAKEKAKDTYKDVKNKGKETLEEAKEKLSETKDQLFGKLDLTRDETGIIEKLRKKVGLSKDMGYSDLLEKLGYGKESLPASSRVNLTPEEIRVVEKLNEYHTSYRRKPALEQFKENIGYNEEPARRHVHHEHLRDQAGMEGKAFPEDISGFGDVINEQKNLKGRIPV